MITVIIVHRFSQQSSRETKLDIVHGSCNQSEFKTYDRHRKTQSALCWSRQGFRGLPLLHSCPAHWDFHSASQSRNGGQPGKHLRQHCKCKYNLPSTKREQGVSPEAHGILLWWYWTPPPFAKRWIIQEIVAANEFLSSTQTVCAGDLWLKRQNMLAHQAQTIPIPVWEIMWKER